MRLHRNVSDLVSAAAFYQAALGFAPAGPATEEKRLASLLGVERVRAQIMRLGAQELVLTQCSSAGAPIAEAGANAPGFQHIAIVTRDMAAAYANAVRHGARPISAGGPSLLPGGLWAFKFRDPEGHALELLEFPNTPPGDALFLGYDHSAIVVSDVARSVAFYKKLGLGEASRQVNTGPAQDALDGLTGALVDVVALGQATPHLELLHYRAPEAVKTPRWRAHDMVADRLDFATGLDNLWLQYDPDSHVLLCELGMRESGFSG